MAVQGKCHGSCVYRIYRGWRILIVSAQDLKNEFTLRVSLCWLCCWYWTDLCFIVFIKVDFVTLEKESDQYHVKVWSRACRDFIWFFGLLRVTEVPEWLDEDFLQLCMQSGGGDPTIRVLRHKVSSFINPCNKDGTVMYRVSVEFKRRPSSRNIVDFKPQETKKVIIKVLPHPTDVETDSLQVRSLHVCHYHAHIIFKIWFPW